MHPEAVKLLRASPAGIRFGELRARIGKALPHIPANAQLTFRYPRRDRAWQLVRVEAVSFHASDPAARKRRVAVPPPDYGRMDLRHIDVDDREGRGPR